MTAMTLPAELTCQERLDALRATKLAQTQEKQRVLGAMDHDDWALILPPPELRKVVQAISGSGVAITDALIDGVQMVSNHANGGFYGPRVCGENFRRLLDAHPPYIDPMCSIAGAVMANFASYRRQGWNPDFDYSHLHAEQQKYQLVSGIGGGERDAVKVRQGERREERRLRVLFHWGGSGTAGPAGREGFVDRDGRRRDSSWRWF